MIDAQQHTNPPDQPCLDQTNLSFFFLSHVALDFADRRGDFGDNVSFFFVLFLRPLHARFVEVCSVLGGGICLVEKVQI